MILKLKPLLLSAALVSAGLTLAPAQAATVTANMPVEITIQNACEIAVAPTTLNFGIHGVLSANIDNTSTMSVTCTNAAVYDIGLDGGGSANVNARLMVLGTEDVGYQLYRDSARTLVWGDTVGADTLNATGTGAVQLYTVFGRVPPQATPSAGVYTDTVLVTVTF